MARFEAENGTLAGTAAVATDHTGYSGTGFVAGWINSTTAQVTFNLAGIKAGTYTLTFGYAAANGGPVTTMNLWVNGSYSSTPSFPVTANWDTWGTITASVTLVNGSNTINLRAITSARATRDKGTNTTTRRAIPPASQCINLDYIGIAGLVYTGAVSESVGVAESVGSSVTSGGTSTNSIEIERTQY